MVETINVGDGRVMCKFETSNRVVKKMYMDPSALELAENPDAQELPPAYGQQMVGAEQAPAITGRVQLSMPGTQRDGAMGWVMAPGIPDAMGNIKVQLDGEATIVEIPSSYLQQIQGATMDGISGSLRTGERVEIQNMNPMAGAPNHNGRTGAVETVEPGTGNVVVRLDEAVDGTARLVLNPGYLKSLETGMDAAPPVQHPALRPQVAHQPNQAAFGAVASSASLQPGDMVRIKGMAARPQHDGKVGTIKQSTPDGLLVELQGENTSLILNASYLEAC